jgi:hypothetical protein
LIETLREYREKRTLHRVSTQTTTAIALRGDRSCSAYAYLRAIMLRNSMVASGIFLFVSFSSGKARIVDDVGIGVMRK